MSAYSNKTKHIEKDKSLQNIKLCKLAVHFFLFLFFFQFSLNIVAAGNASDFIVGTWQNGDGRARVEVYKSGQKYYGKVVWLKYPMRDGKPKVDWRNPDPNKQSRPVIGLVIMRGFIYEGNYLWGGGKVYDPHSGNDYSSKMHLINRNTLEVRGYIGVAILGRTEKWTRVEK